MTEFDNTNRGVLFNERANKTKDNDRDYSGSLNVEGVEYWLSGWINQSKKGLTYLTIKLKPKEEKPKAVESQRAAEGQRDDFNDEVPFGPEFR